MVSNISTLLTLTVSLCLVTLVVCNNNTDTTSDQTTSTEKTSTATSTTSSTTPARTGSTAVPSPIPPEIECPKHNGSCDDCVKAASYKCLFCYDGNKCIAYPVGNILPSKDQCDLAKARWGVCWVNFEALIITMSVIGGLILLTITICCIRCFCCRGGDKKTYIKEEAKWERQKQERKQRSDDRKADRKERMDEIRRKYGLVKEDTPYQRFDA